MPRVKGSTPTRNRRKKVLKLAKGYFGSKHLLYRTANEQVMRSLRYSYVDRKKLKREMRKLWIARINAAARMHDISYSKLMHGLKLANVSINRKMLSELAIRDEKAFAKIVEASKKALDNPKAAKVEAVEEVKVEKAEKVVKEKAPKAEKVVKEKAEKAPKAEKTVKAKTEKAPKAKAEKAEKPAKAKTTKAKKEAE